MIEIVKSVYHLENFGGDEWKHFFYDVINTFNNSNEISLFQRLYFKNFVLIVLRNRLLITDKITRHPAITTEVIKRPLIITGMPRTGTTILFEMISECTDLRMPRGYEAYLPVEDFANSIFEGTDRNELAQSVFDLLMDAYPDLKTQHFQASDSPVECGHLAWLVTGNLPSSILNKEGEYQTIIENFNINSNYKWQKLVLQILQYRGGDNTWLLKCPMHLHFLDKLFETYPDARVLHTHRDPVSAIPSLLSHIDAKSERVISVMEGGLRKSIAQRRNKIIPSNQIADIFFSDLISDPAGTIKKALITLDIEFDEDIASKILNFLNKKPREKYGKHLYTAENHGLTNDEIRKRFKFYTDHYNIELEY